MTCPEKYERRIGKAAVSGSSPIVGNGGELIGSAKGGMVMLDEKEEIKKQLMIFVSDAASNSLIAHGGMPIYDAPLMAIAAADDPMFDKLKEPGVIGPDHLVPQDFLAGARSVISYFLPFTKEIRQSNQSPGLPSEEWVSARIDGEAFNNEVRRHLVALVEELDGQGVAPTLEPLFQVHEVASNWSKDMSLILPVSVHLACTGT